MAENQKRPQYRSPKLVFIYPKLTTPDTKFKEEGEYSTKGRAPGDDPDVVKLIQLIDEEAAKSLQEAQQKAKTPLERKKWETKYLPYTNVCDEEGNETGEVEFKFSMKASGVSKKTGKPWTRKPALFDAKGKPITGSPSIGTGTVGKISFEIIPYAPTTQVGASVKLALNAAQIIELKEFGDKSAAAYGFDAEEGYDSAEAESEGGFTDETPAGDDASAQRDF